MRRLSILAFAAGLLASSAALAQDTVVIELSGVRADLATQLNVGVGQVPDTVSLSTNFAAQVCGIEDPATLESVCTAVRITPELLTVLQASIGDGNNGNGNNNSAREFAPGQQDGPAKDSAPGQQEGAAKDSAPGQVKKN